LRCSEQARPTPGHPDQQGPVAAAQSKTRRRTPQGDAELMAKEQVLRFKPTRRLEEVDDEHCERMQEREHRPRSCGDSIRRCDSKPDGIFGKDRCRVWGNLWVGRQAERQPIDATHSEAEALSACTLDSLLSAAHTLTFSPQ